MGVHIKSSRGNMTSSRLTKVSVAAATLLFLTALVVDAQVIVSPGGWLRVEGDSTLHRWASTATVVEMNFIMADGAPGSLREAIRAGKVKSMDLRISVAGLKSGESGLDKNLRKAMNEGEFHDITYQLAGYEFVAGPRPDVWSAKTNGTLRIAGTAKPLGLDVEFALVPDAVSIKGSTTFAMSDYGIKPPTLMLGAIKVRDPVTIRFDLLLKSAEPAKKAGS
jgi:hypothetical protein